MKPQFIETRFTKDFTLSGGAHSRWRLNVPEVMTDLDWDSWARLALYVAPPWSQVIGVPSGGIALANAIRKYSAGQGDRAPALLVDDVWTSGRSMTEISRAFPEAHGIVLFARGPVPSWVTPLWTVHPDLMDHLD